MSTELAPYEVATPIEIVRHASIAAEELARVVKDRRLAKVIQGREFLTAEAWGALGEMLDLSVLVDQPQPFTDGLGGKGYLCRAHIIRPDGRELSAATAICTRSEKRWGRPDVDDYAIFSMVQTRAIGKAYRSRLSFIAVLAGYEPTPAEEMPEPSREAATALTTRQRVAAMLTELTAEEKDTLRRACEAAGVTPSLDSLTTRLGEQAIDFALALGALGDMRSGERGAQPAGDAGAPVPTGRAVDADHPQGAAAPAVSGPPDPDPLDVVMAWVPPLRMEAVQILASLIEKCGPPFTGRITKKAVAARLFEMFGAEAATEEAAIELLDAAIKRHREQTGEAEVERLAALEERAADPEQQAAVEEFQGFIEGQA